MPDLTAADCATFSSGRCSPIVIGDVCLPRTMYLRRCCCRPEEDGRRMRIDTGPPRSHADLAMYRSGGWTIQKIPSPAAIRHGQTVAWRGSCSSGKRGIVQYYYMQQCSYWYSHHSGSSFWSSACYSAHLPPGRDIPPVPTESS